jgi:hypothetical protein
VNSRRVARSFGPGVLAFSVMGGLRIGFQFKESTCPSKDQHLRIPLGN